MIGGQSATICVKRGDEQPATGETGVSLILLFPPSLGRLKAGARAQALADMLGRSLHEPVAIDVAATYAELEQRVLESDVDLAWAPPSVCARAEAAAPAVFKSIRRGRAEYYSALVGRARATPALDGLTGLRAAWVDPLSAGGHLLAVSLLRKLGSDPDRVFSEQTYHGSYQGAMLAVLGGQAEVSAVYARDPDPAAAREALSAHVGASASELAAFAFTDPTPNDGLIVTSRAGHVAQLIFDLEKLTDSAQGPDLMCEIFEADRLVRAARGDYGAVASALSPPGS